MVTSLLKRKHPLSVNLFIVPLVVRPKICRRHRFPAGVEDVIVVCRLGLLLGGGGADAMSESLVQALNRRLEANGDIMHRWVFFSLFKLVIEQRFAYSLRKLKKIYIFFWFNLKYISATLTQSFLHISSISFINTKTQSRNPCCDADGIVIIISAYYVMNFKLSYIK